MLECVFQSLFPAHVALSQEILFPGRGKKQMKMEWNKLRAIEKQLSVKTVGWLQTMKDIMTWDSTTIGAQISSRLLTVSLVIFLDEEVKRLEGERTAPRRTEASKQDNELGINKKIVGQVTEGLLKTFVQEMKRPDLNIEYIKTWIREGCRWLHL